ncbi:MAG TPA: DUF3597 domain-containing protein [Thermoanaerobaculia bacterium]|nr:DUF3597 domain-containing protein [Thermoanaerobaculia bacterium]
MGMLKELMSKIFVHKAVAEAPVGVPSAKAQVDAAKAAAAPSTAGAAGTAAPGAGVDVAAILNGLAAKHHEKLDWKHSIVDLMKLVGMDSSLSARKELAADLHYTGDTNDSAAMNMWLHKEVMKKLAANGGHVPADLLSH